MLWAAFCTGFLGFLRAGEFTCPSQEAFAKHMLSPGDVAVDSHRAPTCPTIHLKQSKMDPFSAGTTLHVGATGDALPVTAILAYLAIRPSVPGPLFVFENGLTLSRPRLIRALHQVLCLAGIDDSLQWPQLQNWGYHGWGHSNLVIHGYSVMGARGQCVHPWLIHGWDIVT